MRVKASHLYETKFSRFATEPHYKKNHSFLIIYPKKIFFFINATIMSVVQSVGERKGKKSRKDMVMQCMCQLYAAVCVLAKFILLSTTSCAAWLSNLR